MSEDCLVSVDPIEGTTAEKPVRKKIAKLVKVEDDDENDLVRKPFGRTVAVEKPTYQQKDEQKATTTGPTRQELLQRLRRARQNKAMSRSSHAVIEKKNPGAGGPSKQTKKQMAKDIAKYGMEQALSRNGIEDPALQRIITQAYSNGDINDMQKMTELIQQYYANMASTGGVAAPIAQSPTEEEQQYPVAQPINANEDRIRRHREIAEELGFVG